MGECLKWPKILRHTATVSITARCESTPSLTTNCSVCAKQPYASKLPSLSAFFMLLALSATTIYILLLDIFQFSNIDSKA